jgi:hypothetical protein
MSQNRRRSLLVAAVTVAVASAVVGGTQISAASSAASGATNSAEPAAGAEAPNPLANYTEPKGPRLTEDQLRAIALGYAERGGDSSPTSIEALDTTLAAAIGADGHESPQPPSSSGLAAFEASEVTLITMHGHFTLSDEPLAPGAPAPTGQVLALAVDVHTGAVDFEELGEVPAAGDAALGRAQPLG